MASDPETNLPARWDGIPGDPTRDGPHWLRTAEGELFVCHWNPETQMWTHCDEGDTYVEPVLFPDEVAALRRQA